MKNNEIIRNLEEHHVLAFVDSSYSPDANGRKNTHLELFDY